MTGASPPPHSEQGIKTPRRLPSCKPARTLPSLKKSQTPPPYSPSPPPYTISSEVWITCPVPGFQGQDGLREGQGRLSSLPSPHASLAHFTCLKLAPNDLMTSGPSSSCLMDFGIVHLSSLKESRQHPTQPVTALERRQHFLMRRDEKTSRMLNFICFSPEFQPLLQLFPMSAVLFPAFFS